MANDQIILGGGGPAGRIDEPVPPAASPAGFKDQSGNLALGSLDGSGNLKVAVTGAGSGGTSSVDEATFTPGVSAGTPVMGAVNPSDNPADGTLAIAALDSDRNLKVNIVAGGTGGGAVTIADGADVTEGAIADVAVTGDNSGTVSAKLRGLDKIWADVWDSVNHWLKVSIQNATLAVTQSGSWTVTAAQATFASLKATITGNGTAGTPDAGVVTVQGITSMTALKVDGSAITQPVSGTVTVQQGTATNLKAAVTGIGTAGSADTGVQTIQGIASMTPVQVSQATAASLNATIIGAGSAGTANAGVVTVQGIASMTKLLVTPDANSTVVVNAATSGGWTPYNYISSGAANQDSQNVKNSAGQLGYVSVFSTVTSLRVLKLYDKSSAPTSSDTPIYSAPLPANTTGSGSNLPIPSGMAFASGIGFRITTGVANSDTGAASANDVVVNLGYK